MKVGEGHRKGKLFIKGQVAWNKGKKGIHVSPKTEFKKGLTPWNKGTKGTMTGFWKNKKRPEMSGEKHPRWRGGRKYSAKKWRVNNREKVLFLAKQRYRRKRASGGTHTLGEWQTLKAQYDFTCPCCKRKEPEVTLTEDHIIPLSKGGSDNIENIQPLCRSCNARKHTETIKYEI